MSTPTSTRGGASSAYKPPKSRGRLLLLVAIGVLIVLIVVVLVLTSLRGGGTTTNTLPPGTQVFPENNHHHVTTSVRYNRNPPAGGAHSAVWLNCGIYNAPVPNVNAVHSLEHGAVWLTYQPNLPVGEVTRLRDVAVSLYDGPQRYVIVSPYPGLPAPIVASAWGAQLRVSDVSSPSLVAFLRHFVGGSQGGEPGAACTGGLGHPLG